MQRSSIEHEPFICKDNDNDDDDDCEEELQDLPAKTHSQAQHRRRSTRSRFKPTPICIAILVSAICSSMLTMVVQSLVLAYMGSGTTRAAAFALPQLNVSDLGPVTKQFKDETAVYLNRSSPEGIADSEKAWNSLIPKGRGFVSLSKLLTASQFQIPQYIIDMDVAHAGQFSVSSFHQLHCLHMVVKSYFSALGNHDHDVVHAKHCLEYLRSSIVCAADSALEPWKEELHGVDGFESRHMCRDFGALFEWAEKYRFSDIDP